MSNRALVAFVSMLFLLPAQAFAALCFQAQGVNSSFTMDVKLTVEGGPAEGFVNLLGVAIPTSCEPAESALFNGAARLLPDGSAQLNLVIGGTPSCFARSLSMILHPPAFNGMGGVEMPGIAVADLSTGEVFSFFDEVNITLVPCNAPSAQDPAAGNPQAPDRRPRR